MCHNFRRLSVRKPRNSVTKYFLSYENTLALASRNNEARYSSGSGFVSALVLPQGNAADSRHLVAMVKEQITNTGVIPAMTSADDGYSSQAGLEEVLHLGIKVVSISGAKGKKLIEAPQWKSQPYRQARAERSAIESLVFTLKEDFEFGEMARRTHENVLAEMLEKVLAYNISQIIRVRKKLSEPEQMERAAA